jgi:pimeloyl-ACP methyl ester carboxylesterase
MASAPSVREVEVGGTTLAVREWGDPGGRAILFWHALGPAMSAAYAAELEPALGEGWRLVAPDGPGFGASPVLPPEGYRIESLVGLLWELGDALGVERAVLAGHSWGGVVASVAAAQQPERTDGLVLFDSGHRDYQDDPGFDPHRSLESFVEEASRRRLRVDGWDELWAEFADAIPRPLTDALREAVRAGVREEPDGTIVGIPTAETSGAARHGLAVLRVSDAWPRLAEAEIPVLALLATQPGELRAANEVAGRRYRDAVPQAEIRLVDDASHSMLTDVGPEVARLVGDWLARLPARPA